ncbi:alpha/beta hydrolase [Chlorogloeopsis sp. ULAP01]|uniref:alpha/beta fold hydrolase n=1 Tax=Chlorogloeopsis sp. ULAP01 TaxID=3056483 RepID=UPI0025AB0273|nr:alpha/beta hydrolase [Chlorogloeopsis sp. ULAP01]MDM9379228.1 alpha/beta hydrolase [Chlorogloeopsis sp. ULAP01]
MPFLTADDGVPIYYTDQGQGIPIFLIHGWMMNHQFFKYNIPVLAQTHRVVTMDIRGHGYSGKQEINWTLQQAARDVRQIVNYLDLSEVILVGWSMGTTLIHNYFDQFGGEKLKGAVFIDMTPYLLKTEDWEHAVFGKMDLQAAVNLASSIIKDRMQIAEKFVPGCFNVNQVVDPALRESWMRESMLTPNSAMVAFWLDMVTYDWRSHLAQIPVPVLLCYGAHSAVYPTQLGKHMHERIHNSQLIMFEYSGHSPFWEEPERFNAEVARFAG